MVLHKFLWIEFLYLNYILNIHSYHLKKLKCDNFLQQKPISIQNNEACISQESRWYMTLNYPPNGRWKVHVKYERYTDGQPISSRIVVLPASVVPRCLSVYRHHLYLTTGVIQHLSLIQTHRFPVPAHRPWWMLESLTQGVTSVLSHATAHKDIQITRIPSHRSMFRGAWLLDRRYSCECQSVTLVIRYRLFHLLVHYYSGACEVGR
jgi:hypothetical protein